MPQQPGALETVATTMASLLEPLGERLAASQIRLLLAELGLQFPPALDTAPELANTTAAAVQQIQEMRELAEDLVGAIQSEDIPGIIAKGLELANAVRLVIQATENVANGLKAAGAGMGIPPAELNQFADELPGRLIEYLIARRLEALPGAAPTLEFIGAMERTELPEVDPQHPAYVRRRIHINEFTNFIQDPATHLKNKYEWGAPGFDGVALLQMLQRVLAQAGVPAVLDTSGPVPVLDLLFLEVSPRTDVNPPGLLVSIADSVRLDNAGMYGQDDWQVRLVLDTQIAVGSQIIVQPNDNVTFIPPSGQVQGDVLVEWVGGGTDGQPYLILGQTGGSRVEARQLVARVGAGFIWNPSANRAEGVFKVAGEVEQGRVVVNLAEADGFLRNIIAGSGLESEFSFGFGFSTREGLFFEGSSTLDIQLPLHASLGPLEVSALTLTVGIQDNRFPVGVATDVKATLGPLQAVVQQIGIRADLSLPEDHKGNVGPVDFALAFKPPTGAALSIDAGAVTGGGFLFFDPQREQYAGGMHLELEGGITLNAIGLLTTRMPDGTRGFSLLVIVQASGFAPVQLGFGFTLNGVGGLLGINRTVATEVLRAGVRNRSLEPVLFSQDDPTPRAPQIVSALQSVFPPARERYVFGPMALIGWGTPTVLTIEVALVLELPAPVRLMVLGRLRAALPKPDAALVTINMDAFGLIDFERREASVDATLYDSTVGPFALTGDMALRAVWGYQPAFLLSIGGFHPAFSPPPGLPMLRRLAIALSTGNNPRLRAEAYLAITSNTVQIGAGLEFYVEALGFNLSGGFAFDALLQLSPFRFQVDIRAYLALRRGRTTLAGLDVLVHLDGPTPWHAAGQARIRILFFSVTVQFEATFGDPAEIPPRERVAIWNLLKPELQNTRNWTTQLPEDAGRLAAFRDGGAGEPLVHPLGSASVSQRVVPLNRDITRFGAAEPDGPGSFKITDCEGLALKDPTFEYFAPAQFFAMSDAEKLSSPSFDRMPSGAQVAADAGAVASGEVKTTPLVYETKVVEDEQEAPEATETPEPPPEPYEPSADALASLAEIGPAARAEVRSTGRARFRPPGDPQIEVSEERYVVATADELNPAVDETELDGSYTGALEALRREIDGDPGKADGLQVVRAEELVLA